MNVAKFNPTGGPITATVASGFAQPGSYTLFLWEAHANKIVLSARGNFINSDDDTYKLPLPNPQNQDRIVQAIDTVGITLPIRNYDLRLTIHQDGGDIGEETVTGQAKDPSVTADLFLRLEPAS